MAQRSGAATALIFLLFYAIGHSEFDHIRTKRTLCRTGTVIALHFRPVTFCLDAAAPFGEVADDVELRVLSTCIHIALTAHFK